MSSDTTTVKIDRTLHERLKDMKPMPSCSFSDLIKEMADVYENER